MVILNIALRLPYTVRWKQPRSRSQTHLERETSEIQDQTSADDAFDHTSAASINSNFASNPDSAAKELFGGETNINQGPEGCSAIDSSKEEPVQAVGEDDAWMIVDNEKANFGLRSVLAASVEREMVENLTWIGTVDELAGALPASHLKSEIEDCLEHDHNSIVVFCRESDFDGSYKNYCKKILWPIFHYQIPDHPRDRAYLTRSWADYVRMNQAFADKAISNWKRGDLIWIHDYHLLLVPAMIREKLFDAVIGFFLHSAFPSSEVFRCISEREILLQGVLGANLIGFQTQEYMTHFLQTCHRLLRVEISEDGIQLETRYIGTISIPVGVHPKTLLADREHQPIKKWMKLIQERHEGKRLIVARDKLDAVSGLRQKMVAYELYLKQNPKMRGKVVLIQICTSTDQSKTFVQGISEVIDRVNTTFATLTYQPIVFLNQDIGHQQYLALLAMADALLITNLRESMNLSSHEFVLSQDGLIPGCKKHGCLIMSEFTGNSAVFGDSSIVINPWDYQQCADAIRRALTMEHAEKERMWKEMCRIVKDQDAQTWCTRYLEELKRISSRQHDQDFISIPRLLSGDLRQKYQSSSKRLFILDFEYALAAWDPVSEKGIYTSQQRVVDTIYALVEDSRNVVYLLSTRKPEELDQILYRAPDLGLIAESGCFLKLFGTCEWTTLADVQQIASAKKSMKKTMDYFSERIAGSWLEDLHCSVTLHYGNAEDIASAQKQAGEYASQINDTNSEQDMHAISTSAAMTVKPTKWTRYSALQKAFPFFSTDGNNAYDGIQEHQFDFLFLGGGSQEDEPILRWANELGKRQKVKDVFTVNVGTRPTEAQAASAHGLAGILSTLRSPAT